MRLGTGLSARFGAPFGVVTALGPGLVSAVFAGDKVGPMSPSPPRSLRNQPLGYDARTDLHLL